MPIASEVGFAPRIRVSPVLVRGSASETRLEFRLGDDAASVDSVAYELRSPTGASLYSVAATIDAGVATVTVPADNLPSTLAFGSGYREYWSPTVSGVAHPAVPRSVYLARYPLHCPVTQADLEEPYGNLGDLMRGSPSDLQSYLDSTWTDTLQRLISAGVWPETMVQSDTLIPYVKHETWAAIFRSFSMGPGGEQYRRLAADHKMDAREAWSRISYTRDLDQDGVPDGGDRFGVPTIVSRNTKPPYRYARGPRGHRVF